MKRKQAEKIGGARNGNRLTTVIVNVPFKSTVAYEVEVSDPHNLKEIKQALEEKDPEDWLTDPNFYESLGNSYRHLIHKITLEDVLTEGED
jgi:hypothetical protein